MTLGSTVISLVANIAQMFYQLLLLPVFSISQISDEGKLFKKYMQAFWGKFWVIIISQLSFSFFLYLSWILDQPSMKYWNKKPTCQSMNFQFLFSFLMILGGGIAIKTIGEEFASYFGGQGFVRCQQEWAHRTTKGIGITAGLLGASSALAGKGVKDSKKLTGYHDAKREEINNAFKKGEITGTQKREMLEKLKDDRGNLGQTFRSGWMNNKHKNILTKAWRAKNAYKEGKDLGVIEEAKYLGSKMLFRHNIRGIENKEAKISKNQQK
ncbi:Mbov_0396 family ICE element transmembrane protein [Mesomycoplasma ovipneumoniae]|uniref:Mbov_0396 family ICE element transmembrane protein n=1 Tax=Mesomycoplasma ovipneumoniae TaxID=29562 RepID=UPI0028A8D96A|nr:hypothetical protein [Mesomycoplasma ovipneumoniae]WNM15067.1 hypothetical protein RNM01_00285 [Mesomycoplasma ovipneumoniae]